MLVIALVVASLVGHHSTKPTANNIQLDSVAEMLRGVPQHGIELGNPKAKVTLTEVSDPQCPYCGDWARTVFPVVVQNYVKPGKVRVEYKGVDILDPPDSSAQDSSRLLRLAQAAGLQNKLWNVVELEFENQGTEGSGYATDAFLRGIAQSVTGMNADKALSVANTNAVVPLIDSARVLAEANFGKRFSTPSFLVGRTGSVPTVKIVGDQPFQSFAKAIDAQLKK